MLRVLFMMLSLAAGVASGEESELVENDSLVLVFEAEDQTPTGKFTTATEVKPIIAATQGNWIAVREWEGNDLIYVTHLWAWRCGLVQVELRVNDGPLEVWQLPDCHIDTAQPNGITDTDGLPYRSFALSSVERIQVRITFDDLTTQEATFERKDVLLP